MHAINLCITAKITVAITPFFLRITTKINNEIPPRVKPKEPLQRATRPSSNASIYEFGIIGGDAKRSD